MLENKTARNTSSSLETLSHAIISLLPPGITSGCFYFLFTMPHDITILAGRCVCT